MKSTSPVEQTQIQDENSGYFTMIPNIVFKLGLSAQAESAYCRLKWQAGANLKALPRQERRISKLIGVSRQAWNRVSKELRESGLIYFRNETIVLTGIMSINSRHFEGKLSLVKATEEIRKLGGNWKRDPVSSRAKAKQQSLGPNSGQNLGPNSGQKSGPNSGHMINNYKNNNMKVNSSSPKVPPRERSPQADDDDFSLTNHRQIVKRLFTELSNGTAWKETRDAAAYNEIAAVSAQVIAIGLCYTVTKSPDHKLGSLSYAVEQIRKTQADIGAFSNADLHAKAQSDYRKTRLCIQFGKWTLTEMTPEQQEQVLPRKAGRKRAASTVTRMTQE